MIEKLKEIIWRQVWNLIVRYFKIPIFGKRKLFLAFEYGVVLSEVAKEQGVVLTPEMVKRAEETVFDVFRKSTPEQAALEMHLILLAIFEPDMA